MPKMHCPEAIAQTTAAASSPCCQPPLPSSRGPSRSWSSTSSCTRAPHPPATPLPHPTAVYASAASSSAMTELFIDTTMRQQQSCHHNLDCVCDGGHCDSLSPTAHAFRTVRFRHNLNIQQQHEQQHSMLLRCARHERNSSSSSDSGLPPSAGPFSLSPPFSGTLPSPCDTAAGTVSSWFTNTLRLPPPAPGSTASMSPPGLSPLQIADSAFVSATTTPSSVPLSQTLCCCSAGAATVCMPAGTSRFRFDHLLPSPLAATVAQPATLACGEEAPTAVAHGITAPSIASDELSLKRMRHSVGTQPAATAELWATSTANAASNRQSFQQKVSVCRSESLPTVRPSPIAAPNLAVWLRHVRQLNALLSPRLPAQVATFVAPLQRTAPPAFVARELAARSATLLFRQQVETHSLLPPAPSSLRLLGRALSSTASPATVPSSSSPVTVPCSTTCYGMTMLQQMPPPPSATAPAESESMRKEMIKQQMELHAIKMMASSASLLSSSNASHAEMMINSSSSKTASDGKKCHSQQQQQMKQYVVRHGEADDQQQMMKHCADLRHQNGHDDDAKSEGEEEEQFMCTICNKDFRRPDILSRHLRRHTGEKPFGCDWCGRFFSRSDHLRTHQRTHTDEKPYRCAVCPYAARRRDVLSRHMGTRHALKAAGRSFFPRKRRRIQYQQQQQQQQINKLLLVDVLPAVGAAPPTGKDTKGQCSSSSTASTAPTAQCRVITEDRMRRLLRAHLLKRKSRTLATAENGTNRPEGRRQQVVGPKITATDQQNEEPNLP